MLEFIVTPIAKFDFSAVRADSLVKVGEKDEKRKAENVITVCENGKTWRNYIFWDKGPEKLLIKALALIRKVQAPVQADPGEYKAAMIALVNCLWIVNHKNTDKQNSKLAGLSSLSTCCLDNPACLARMKDKDSVCSHCYAAAQQRRNFGLTQRNLINGLILRNVGIPVWAWQCGLACVMFDKHFFRIESFGDTASIMQVCNYLTFIKAFPAVQFAAWTKNVNQWFNAMDCIGKPENLSFVTSSYRMNETDEYQDSRVNHTFTVYDHNFAENNDIHINCGGRSCMECIIKHQGCYYTDTARIISELVK